MLKSLGKVVLFFSFAALVAAAPMRASAQDMSKSKATNKPPATASAKSLPFTGKLGAVDTSAKTITLDESTKRVFQITSETKITRADKPAILSDAVVGEAIRGSYKKTDDGKLVAVSLFLGPKTDATKPKTTTKTNSVPMSKN
jgi:hypothetical protein